MRTTLAPFDECHERYFALDVVRIVEHVFLVPDVAEMLTQISELTGYPGREPA